MPALMRSTVATLALILSGLGSALAQDTAPAAAEALPWDSIGQEAAELLSLYIQVNTTNPPGREIAAARFLRDQLVPDGIEFLLIDQGDGKAALIGRLRAAGSSEKGAIVLLNHMDVVESSRDHWSVDPYAGRIRDGYVWGRGALDMKGTAIAQLVALKLLARGPALDRDIIFLATSDEEVTGGTDAGIFLRDHGELLEGAEFVINEGGAIRTDEDGKLLYYGVGVTEKSPFWHVMRARGVGGHGSQPITGSAVNRLVEALERIREWETPIQVTPPVAEFFERLALVSSEKDAELYADLEESLADSTKREHILSDRYHNAILRNTVSITRLEGSHKTNVIPPTAEAELDIRLLPGQDPDDFLEQLKERAGIDDQAITLELLGISWPASSSPTDSELFQAIEAQAEAMDSGASVIPYVLAGFTDSHYFREMGIEAYGLGLFKLPAAESARIHGNDERVSIENLQFGTRFLYELLLRMGS